MLNLDTHIVIYLLAGELNAKENQIVGSGPWGISAIVLWEIAKLVELKRIEIEFASSDFADLLQRFHVWPIDYPLCLTLRQLDFKSDPADELIAATSLLYQVPLLTRDRKIRRSRVVPLAK